MPRYLVERSFPDGLEIPINDNGAAACLDVVGKMRRRLRRVVVMV